MPSQAATCKLSPLFAIYRIVWVSAGARGFDVWPSSQLRAVENLEAKLQDVEKGYEKLLELQARLKKENHSDALLSYIYSGFACQSTPSFH